MNATNNTPHIPCKTGPTLYPIVLFLQWLSDIEKENVSSVAIQEMPFSNGSLPDLLRLANIDTLIVPDESKFPTPFKWESKGGHRITIAKKDDEIGFGLDLHHGSFQNNKFNSPSKSVNLDKLINLARLEDASAVLTGTGDGAKWDHILSMLAEEKATNIPSLSGRISQSEDLQFQAWNPTPISRFCPIAIKFPLDQSVPWGIIDNYGRKFPLQIIGETYTEKEAISIVDLGALESVKFVAYNEPVPSATWEVSETVLDNGLLRVELDEYGHIIRLCINENFQTIAAPLCGITVNDIKAHELETTVLVSEEGSVRSSICVNKKYEEGDLEITYSLYAETDYLHINAKWSNADDFVNIELPTAYRRSPLKCAGELAPWTVAQSASVFRGKVSHQAGVRWASLSDESSTDGMSVIGKHTLNVAAYNGNIQIQIQQECSFVITNLRGSKKENLSPGQLSNSINIPGRCSDFHEIFSEFFKVDGNSRLVPIWISKPKDWICEIIFTEQEGKRGKVSLFPYYDELPTEACIVDIAGNTVKELKISEEDECFTIEHQPYDLFKVRWR